jgi:hypothetical protein
MIEIEPGTRENAPTAVPKTSKIEERWKLLASLADTAEAP